MRFMLDDSKNNSPEIWGGIECTINRVNDNFFDQLKYSQHYKRESDIELIADLGIKKIRYPVLWEKHQPQISSEIDWNWTERRLNLLRDKNIDVIAGLVHHGSGPAFTHLLDDNFPVLLAQYAKKVAEKFPWLEYYTPVNEPLTTARFSGLYGLWYPHKASGKEFAKMLLNEMKATVLAMAEIKKINPNAKLVQTEDLGKVYSTKKLRYQAKFENERRWLTFDLLCGKVDEKHLMWKHFKNLRIPEKDVRFFLDHPCVPDIFGFNHYVTSERYLDENLSAYPKRTHGGNGRHRYADVEVARVEVDEETGIETLLKEAWDRYQKPIAITEVHLHCHREEQLRWFKYIWNACLNVQKKGVEIKGVTAWALLGSFGWNKLLTKPRGLYEPGVFDLRGGRPRATALAKFIKRLNSEQDNHPVSHEPGWWLRSSRLIFQKTITNNIPSHTLAGNHRPLLIIGKNGTLGRAFARICYERTIPFVLVGREECDITNQQTIEAVINKYNPWAIINAAGYVRVDDAETDCDRCFNENTYGPQILAEACLHHNIKFLTYSSDLVFDGQSNQPYTESDTVNPLNIYGKSKAQSEELVLKINPQSLIIRTAAFFGPWDEYNFLHYVIDNLSKQQQITVANDLYISPTYVPDLVHHSLDLLIDEENGIWHIVNRGSTTWSELAYEVATKWRLNNIFINSMPAREISLQAQRPAYSVLKSEKGIILPGLDNALQRFYNERKISVVAKSII
jgi:dTDP-4-dehydrorhamnose reductase